MAIPKVTLYQKLGKGAEGALHFARIMDQLIFADDKEKGRDGMATSDAAGDYNLRFPELFSLRLRLEK